MGTWTTQDGTKIAITDMGDRHLLNAHRMLCRSLANLAELLDSGKMLHQKHTDKLDRRIYGMMGMAGLLEIEITERELEPLMDLPEHDYFKRLSDKAERDVRRAQYEAYCTERGLPA